MELWYAQALANAAAYTKKVHFSLLAPVKMRICTTLVRRVYDAPSREIDRVWGQDVEKEYSE